MNGADSKAPEPLRRNARRARASSPEVRGASPVQEPPAAAAPRRGGNRRAQQETLPPPRREGLIRRKIRGWFERGKGLATDGRAKVLNGMKVAAKLAMVLLVLVGFGAAGRLVERYVRTSPAFAIREVRVEGASRLPREELLRIGGVLVGRNVFEMPPEDVRARLERHPWIADASVRRRLPGTLEIHVRERRAAAVLVVDRSYLIGEDATVFKSLEPGDPSDLPVITLASHERWLSDRPAFGTLLLDVISLMHDYRRMGLESRGSISEIHVDADDGLSLYLGDDAMQVRLGHGAYEPKLRRLRTLLDEMRRRDAHPAYVMLDHERRPDRVVVRLRETVVPLPPIEESEAPAAPSTGVRTTPANSPRARHG